jgi:hypothetical protein
MNLKKYIKNGLYIPILHGIIYKRTTNMYLASIISLKLYSTNHFFWFGHNEKIKNKSIVQLKQFVRFTDTGHLASFIYFYRPDFLPIAHNVHFIITMCYWIGKCIGIKETTGKNDKDIIPELIILSASLNHGLIYLFLIRDILLMPSDVQKDMFSSQTLSYSYLWSYVWFFCIYLPWRYITHDEVYSILSHKTHIFKKIIFLSIMHVIIYISNFTGKLITG